MKKFLLLSFLIGFAFESFAFVTQGHWRWRNDNGSETTATWLADEDSTATISSSSDNIRLRLELFNTQTDSSDVGTSILTYSADGGTTWDSVSNVTEGRAFVLAGTSPFVSDDETTTQQLSGESGFTFLEGRIVTSSLTLGSNNVAPNEVTEYEWVIRPTENMLPSTTYLFKADTAPGDGSYDGTSPAASLTTAEVLPIQIVKFTVKTEGKYVKLEWTTSSELNNNHIDIERSADGIAWTTIKTLQGNGTTTETRNYSALDNLPLKGMNYYRIKQYDLNGKSYTSEIRSIKMFVKNLSLLSVYPNPSKAIINFSLQTSGTNVLATLTTTDGKIVHQETIKEIQPNAVYKLNIKQQQAPGIYILHLKGNGLVETSKIVVQ